MDFKVVCGDEIKYGTRFDNNICICTQCFLRVLICNALILMTAYVLIWGDLTVVFLGSVWRISFFTASIFI